MSTEFIPDPLPETIPASGSVSASQIKVELGYASTASLSLGATQVRALLGKGTGAISYSDARGKSSTPAYSTSTDIASLAVTAIKPYFGDGRFITYATKAYPNNVYIRYILTTTDGQTWNNYNIARTADSFNNQTVNTNGSLGSWGITITTPQYMNGQYWAVIYHEVSPYGFTFIKNADPFNSPANWTDVAGLPNFNWGFYDAYTDVRQYAPIPAPPAGAQSFFVAGNYLFTQSNGYPDGYTKLFGTADGGTTFKYLTAPPRTTISTLSYDGNYYNYNSGYHKAMTYNGGYYWSVEAYTGEIYKSSTGDGWTLAANHGLQGNPPFRSGGSIVGPSRRTADVIAVNGNTIVVGINDSTDNSTLRISTNGGSTWSTMPNSGLSRTINAIFIANNGWIHVSTGQPLDTVWNTDSPYNTRVPNYEPKYMATKDLGQNWSQISADVFTWHATGLGITLIETGKGYGTLNPHTIKVISTG